MSAFPKQNAEIDTASITGVRAAWLAAVRAGDAEQLASLVTDDVVVVHGDGRCVRGRGELKADFQRGFEAFAIEQNTSSSEIVVRGRWAFDVCEIESVLTPRSGGKSTLAQSITLVALNQQPDGSWKVGRVLGMLQSSVLASE